MVIGIEATHANKKNRTGVEEYCWQIIEQLKKQIPSDLRVVLYSREPLTGELAVLPKNWEVKILSWPFGKGWSQVRLSLEFLLEPPDVFFAPGQLVPFICPKNTIVTVHDSAFLAEPKSYWWASRWYLKLMNRLIVRKAKLILTPSEFSRRELVKYYQFDANKIIVTPLGYNKNSYRQQPADGEVLKKYNISKPFIFTVGRLERKKNTANLIRAFDLIKKQVDCQLVLAGQPGSGYEEIKEVLSASPNQADIIHPGWVEKGDLPKLMAAAEVFAFPSLYEGFGIPVLEAMACGCPVAASRGNSLEEVGGEVAVYINPNKIEEMVSVIAQFLTDKTYRQERSSAGLRRVENFDWSKTGAATWEVLKKLSK